MSSKYISNNGREILFAQGLGGTAEALTSTNGALNVNGSFSITGGSTSANQTNGTQKTQIVDGSGNVISSTSNALNVAVISGGGGGTQYVTGAVQAAPTGTVALGYDGTNVRALKTAVDGTLKTVLSASQANVTGTITTSTSTITATDLTGVGSLTVQIAGTHAGINVTFEASIDGSSWVAIPAQPISGTTPTLLTSTGVLASNSTNLWNISPLLGLAQFRVRTTAYTSGTGNVTIDLSAQFVPTMGTVGGAVTLTNGTNVADIVANDSGLNGVVVNEATKVIAFTTSLAGAQVLGPYDVGAYADIQVQFTSVGSGLALGGQFASDNVAADFATTNTWARPTQTGNSTAAMAAVVGELTHSFTLGRYFRLNITALTSGTVSGNIVLTTFPKPYHTIGASTNLTAGANIVGKVGIDQTTPGTTNAASLAQIGANTVLTGNGTAGTGAQRVTIASDNTAFSVNSLASIKDTYAADTTFTITLASLANSAVGVGRQSTLVDNTTNRYQSALVYLSLKAGTTPTANSPIYAYLIRSNNDNPIADDGAGATDAGLTVINAPLLGVINVSTASTGQVYVGVFDTTPLGPLGPKWGVAIVNNSGAAFDATEGNHFKTFIGVTRSLA